MLGFSFRGTHTNSFQGLVTKTINNPLIASKRVKRITIPGRDGSYVFEDGYENKKLEFKCIVTKGSIQERRLRMRQIASWLSGTGDLVLDYEKDKTYKVVRTVSDISVALDKIIDEFNLEFEVEPFQYGTKKTISVENPGTFVVHHTGNVAAQTLVSLTGTGDVLVTCGNQSFTLNGMTEKLNLDSKRMIVYTESKENCLFKHSGDFIKLMPGDNSITVTGAVTDITIQFCDTYL